jgi:hypothetical protein
MSFHPSRPPTMKRRRMRPICSQSPDRSQAAVPGCTTCAPSARDTTMGLRPRCVTLQLPSCSSIRACTRCTDALPGIRLRSTSTGGLSGAERPTMLGRSACNAKATRRSPASPIKSAALCPIWSSAVPPHSSQISASPGSSVAQRESRQRSSRRAWACTYAV